MEEGGVGKRGMEGRGGGGEDGGEEKRGRKRRRGSTESEVRGEAGRIVECRGRQWGVTVRWMRRVMT